MAERIDFTNIDRNDPRFFEADPDNPNTNISASRFDPTDPTSKGNAVGEKYNEWLRTANIGDKFDWGKESGDPTQKGLVNEFVGFNKMGTPIIKTNVSEARSDWRQTMAGATTFAQAVKKLQDAGFDAAMAQYLVSQSGTDFADQNKYMMSSRGSTGFAQIGATADGKPIYGFGADGKPVTDPKGAIFSTTSASDAITRANSGSSPLTAGSTTGSTSGAVPGSKEFNERKSAYDLLYQQFASYGLGSLVEPLKNLIMENVSPSEFTIRLRDTDAYKKRFAANAKRISQGLRALSEGEYIQLEDQYQDIMRRYGMPESYYKKGDLGIQEGFEKFIAGDVSPVELEDRIQTAQTRLFDANPEVIQSLRNFYPGITNGDILAYALDPATALPELKRKVTAAEIGAGAAMAGLSTGLQRATELASYGVTKEQAQQGFQTVADILPRGSQLADIYKQSPYTQTTAEQEVFGLAGATEAAKQRKKLTSLEQAAFSGTSGMTGGALGRERAGQF